MSTTVQQVINAGYAKSAAARVQSIAAPAQLVVQVGTCLREIFLLLSRENPFILATSALAPFNGLGWARPADCLRVIDVQATVNTVVAPPLAPGKSITIVPFNDLGFSLGASALTELGQVFVPTGQAQDPSGGTVTIIYARAPILPAQATDTIDPLFPDTFADLLASDVAAYLAAEDSRDQDKATFLAQKGVATSQLVEWSRGQTYTLQQRFPVVTPPLTNTSGGKQSPADG